MNQPFYASGGMGKPKGLKSLKGIMGSPVQPFHGQAFQEADLPLPWGLPMAPLSSAPQFPPLFEPPTATYDMNGLLPGTGTLSGFVPVGAVLAGAVLTVAGNGVAGAACPGCAGAAWAGGVTGTSLTGVALRLRPL
jgi:hypothetical protein